MPASTCCRRTPHDLPNHKSEFGKSPIERVGNIDIQHDPSGQPQCALRLSEPVKSSLYPSALRRVKRTHAANQMKRVQRVEDSLAQVWGRAAPNGLPAENTSKPICSRKSALTPRRRLRSPSPPFSAFPRPFVLRRDRHKKNVQARSEPGKPDNRTDDSRTHYRRSRPTAEQERNIPQAVLFGAMRQTSGVFEHRTFRENRMMGVNEHKTSQ